MTTTNTTTTATMQAINTVPWIVETFCNMLEAGNTAVKALDCVRYFSYGGAAIPDYCVPILKKHDLKVGEVCAPSSFSSTTTTLLFSRAAVLRCSECRVAGWCPQSLQWWSSLMPLLIAGGCLGVVVVVVIVIVAAIVIVIVVVIVIVIAR